MIGARRASPAVPADTASGSDTERELHTEIFGREVRWAYDEGWVGYSVLALRVVMGWIFLQAGLEKVFDPEWTAAGYLQNAVPEGNPFGDLWLSMAGSPLVDALVAWGLTLIGLCLIVGLLVRFSAFWGAVMMLFFWASALQGGLLQGLPLEHGWVVDDHIVYAVLLFGLGAFGAGRILGLDRRLEESNLVQNNPWLTYLLG